MDLISVRALGFLCAILYDALVRRSVSNPWILPRPFSMPQLYCWSCSPVAGGTVVPFFLFLSAAELLFLFFLFFLTKLNQPQQLLDRSFRSGVWAPAAGRYAPGGGHCTVRILSIRGSEPCDATGRRSWELPQGSALGAWKRSSKFGAFEYLGICFVWTFHAGSVCAHICGSTKLFA